MIRTITHQNIRTDQNRTQWKTNGMYRLAVGSQVIRWIVEGSLFRKTDFQPKRIMTSAQNDVEEQLKRNPYYEKYAKKLQSFQKSSPEDFMQRVEETINRKTKQRQVPSQERGFSSVGKSKCELTGDTIEQPYKKVLSDIMKMDLVEGLGPDEISRLWETYFKDKDAISATVKKEIYQLMYERGKKYPIFVLPLPRGEGYEFFVCETKGNEVHFTSLINYQAHKENAPECLAITHFTELQNKGIVLLHGEFDKDMLNVQETQCLANQYQLYYGKDNQKRLNLLERLNYTPDDFKHMDLIAELEHLSLD